MLRLLPGERVVGAARANEDSSVLLASRCGQVKRLAAGSLRACNRGDLGQIGLRFHQREDELVDLREGHAATLGLLLSQGRSLRLSGNQLIMEDSSGSGLQLQLRTGQQVEELIPLTN